MASSGKKSKQKWRPLPRDLVIEQRKPSESWADQVEDLDVTPVYIPNVKLPTEPKASRISVIDESKIPHTGPFQAYISNIPYELNEDELRDVFQNLRVKSVRLPREEKSSKVKGFGYVEFEDRSSLCAALSLGDTMLKGRPIKIDLPNNSDMGRGRMRSNRDRDQDGSSDRTTGNWRSGPRMDDFEDRGYERRGGGGGGFEDRGRREERGGGGGFGGGGSGFSRGGFDREERGFQREDRDRFDRGGGGGRDERGGYRERFGGGRDREGGGTGFSSSSSYGGDRSSSFRDRASRDDGSFSRTEDRGPPASTGSGSWREGREEQPPRDRDRGFGSRGGGGGFEDRGRDERRGGGSFGGDREERRGGFGGDRDDRRGGGGGFGDRDRDRDRGSGFEDRRDRYGPPPPRRDDPPSTSADRSGGGEARNRPKLNLKPRSTPKEAAPESGSGGGATPAAASASIFGGAKPVDTAAREREIEERLMRSEDFAEARSSRSGPGSTGSRGDKEEAGGGAAPTRKWEPAGGAGGGEKQRPTEPAPAAGGGAPSAAAPSTAGAGGEKQRAAAVVEPAPPPRENAWVRKAAQPSPTSSAPVNNGRSSPEDEGSTENLHDEDDSKVHKNGDKKRGGSGSDKGGVASVEKARLKEAERLEKKHRERKESIDDISKMPKIPVIEAPNFAVSNKFSYLVDSEEPAEDEED